MTDDQHSPSTTQTSTPPPTNSSESSSISIGRRQAEDIARTLRGRHKQDRAPFNKGYHQALSDMVNRPDMLEVERDTPDPGDPYRVGYNEALDDAQKAAGITQ